MAIRTTLMFTLALAATVRAQSYGICGERTVSSVESFSYAEFASYKYTYQYFPKDSYYTNIKSANLVITESDADDCDYIATFTAYWNDGTTKVSKLQEDYLGNGKALETLYDDSGYLTSTQFQVVFYGHSADKYTQFYVCKEETGVVGGTQDFRYVIVNNGYSLTSQDIADIKYNDKQQNFNGDLVSLSECQSSSDSSDSDESDSDSSDSDSDSSDDDD